MTASLDLLTFGEALVEVMRTGVDQPLDSPGTFTGPYPSGAPFIFTAQAARLGLRVGAIGAVGDDAFGRCMLDQMKADGIESRGVRVLPDRTTGVAFVAYNADGSRDFVFHARHAASGQLSVGMLDPALFDRLRCLHIMGSTLSMSNDALNTGLRALEMAQAAGAKISFDPNLRPQLLAPDLAREAFQPFVAAADVLLPTVTELNLLTGIASVRDAAAKLIADKPSRIIVVTRGSDGCTVYSANHPDGIHVSGFPVIEVDPTGAGDCFDAGFLARWLAGDSLRDAARYANACGALAVTAKGPMAGAKTAVEVAAFLSRHSHGRTPRICEG